MICAWEYVSVCWTEGKENVKWLGAWMVVVQVCGNQFGRARCLDWEWWGNVALRDSGGKGIGTLSALT